MGPDLTLDKILNEFQVGRTHLAVVRDVVANTRAGAKQTFGNIGLVALAAR